MQSGAIEFNNPRGKDHFSDPGLIGGLRGQNLNGAISFFFGVVMNTCRTGSHPSFVFVWTPGGNAFMHSLPSSVVWDSSRLDETYLSRPGGRQWSDLNSDPLSAWNARVAI